MPLNVNIKNSPYNAIGDGKLVTATLTISAGSPNLSATTAIWTHGVDENKGITVDGIGPNGFGVVTTIVSVAVDGKSIVLAANATTALSSVPMQVAWGTNDSPAFVRFNTDARAASGLVTLTIPTSSPSNVYYLGSLNAVDIKWSRFIPQLKVTWDGVNKPILVGVLGFGSITFPNTDGGTYSARLASVNPGDTTLQLLHISDSVKFHPGNTHTGSDGTVYTSGTTGNLTGIDTEGFGDPTPQFREYVTITGVNDSTGVISLSAPVKYKYLSTWPVFVPGSAFQVDDGGPATLYMFDAAWDASIEFVGIQFWDPSGGINCPARTVKFTNCSWLQNNAGVGFFPATSENWTLDNTTFTGKIEVDKNIHQLNVLNGSSGHRWWLQTAACENMLIDSATMDLLEGTSRFTTINNSTITDLILGPVANGCAGTFTANSCSFSTINYEFAEPILPSPPAAYSISGGRITLSSGSPARWAVPGAHMFLYGAQEASAGFNVLAVSGDGDPFTAATKTYIDTDLNGGWPSIPLSSGGTVMALTTHPAPIATFVNCTGCADAIDYSNPKAQGKPLYTYSNRTYAGVASGATIALVNPVYISTEGTRLWGKIVFVKVTVGTAFTTSGALTLNLFGRFITNACDPVTGALTTWVPAVDLKTPGVRTITSTAISGSVGADSLGPPPGSIFFSGRQAPWLNGTVSGGDPGTVTIEVQTDQGFPSNIPFYLRLHT